MRCLRLSSAFSQFQASLVYVKPSLREKKKERKKKKILTIFFEYSCYTPYLFSKLLRYFGLERWLSP